MDFIISLAHFCETHGPTSILCTQLNPVACSTCYPSPDPPAAQPVEDLTRNSSFSSSFFETPGTPTYDPNAPLLYSPLTSPPTSPYSSSSPYNPYFGEYLSSESGRGSFGTGSSFSSDFDYESCENCSFVVPQDVRDRIPDGAPGSPTKTGGRLGTPILRTTQPVTAYNPVEEEEGLDDEEEQEEEPSRGRTCDHSEEVQDTYFTERDSLEFIEASTSSRHSPPLSAFEVPQTHTHNLTYVTTRQPTSPVCYSLLRRSCIRTLSCETLPKGSPKGPLYFGDPVAGYTIAYIFHVKDQRARGQKRTYALIAMGGRDSWRVSTQYVSITRVFERIAMEIIAMADRVTEREAPPASSSSDGERTPPLSSSLPSPDSRRERHAKDPRESKSAANSPTSRTSSKSGDSISSRLSDVSSFLSAKRVDPDGFARGTREVMQPRGLAEITGSERIFVELHTRFVLLISKLAGHS